MDEDDKLDQASEFDPDARMDDDYNPYDDGDVADIVDSKDASPVSSDNGNDNLSPENENGGSQQEKNSVSSENVGGDTDDDAIDMPAALSGSVTSEEAKSDDGGEEDNNDGSDNAQVVCGSTEDEKKDNAPPAPFDEKISAASADKSPKGNVKILNKRFILSALVVTFGTIMLVAFLMPTKEKKMKGSDRDMARTGRLYDFEASADPFEDEDSDAADFNHYDDKSREEEKKKEEDDIPPLPFEDVKSEKPIYTQPTQSTTSTSGSGSTISIPDTRNDRLQGKSISGIKGLTSTQGRYSTDYQSQIKANTSTGQPTAGYTLPSKEEYMKNTLSMYTQANASMNAYSQQNDQSGKRSFYENGKEGAGDGTWLGLNTIWEGTIFEVITNGAINTDIPGEIVARVAKNIYSSQDGRYLLIPQNSLVLGTYNSSISYAQRRVQVAWHTLIRPDGYQINLGNMNGTDAEGASGVKGFVNDHPMGYLKAIVLMSVFSIVNTEFANQMKNTDNEYVQDIMANGQQVVNELGDKLIDRAMNVQPTLKVAKGTKINIVVNTTFALPPMEQVPVTQPYRKP